MKEIKSGWFKEGKRIGEMKADDKYKCYNLDDIFLKDIPVPE